MIGARLVNEIKHPHHKVNVMAPSLEGKPIDTKETQSEVWLSLVDTNPVYFLVSGIIFVHVGSAY